MTDELSHLDAIELRLSHERSRVATARNPKERAWREHNVRMIEKELVNEKAFLAARGIHVPEDGKPMTDDELLAALGSLDELLGNN